MDKQSYNYLKTVRRCVQCGKQDAYTLNGRTYCAECMEWRNAYYQKRREDPEYAKKWADRSTERRRRFRESGLCPRCGKKPEPPYSLCAKCRAKNRARYRAKKEAAVHEA